VKLEWFGQAGHFVCADRCRFHLHTHVNGYCVSTVGEFYPNGGREVKDMDTVGLGRLYETMVFPLDEMGGVTDWSGLWTEGYNDRDAANAGHAAMLDEWSRR
jgi:hypothetical protein